MALDETIREQAVAWAVQTGDPAFEGWDEFTRWLEQDAAHARAYDEVMASVGDAAEALPTLPVAENDDAPVRVSRRRWTVGGLAAVLVAASTFGVWQAMPATYTVETAPGETEFVDLDGSHVELAGGSRIVLDRDNPRRASLEHGQALFTVEHDPDAPFVVTVGDDTLVDVGTVFDVKHTTSETVLSVSEGAVVFNPKRQNVEVTPGQRLVSAPGSDAYRLTEVPAGQVGEWRQGRLTFDDARLADVAADLSRLSGVDFAVSPGSANQRVSGSLMVQPLRDDPRSLGPLLGVNVRYEGNSWEIGAR